MLKWCSPEFEEDHQGSIQSADTVKSNVVFELLLLLDLIFARIYSKRDCQ